MCHCICNLVSEYIGDMGCQLVKKKIWLVVASIECHDSLSGSPFGVLKMSLSNFNVWPMCLPRILCGSMCLSSTTGLL